MKLKIHHTCYSSFEFLVNFFFYPKRVDFQVIFVSVRPKSMKSAY